MEIFEDEDSSEMTEEEIEEATTVISTGTMVAYENARGFLFAEGKISNQFLYIPKRGLTQEQLTQIQEFAKERCSGGYHLLEMKSMISADEDGEQSAEQEAPADDSFVSGVCKQFYGADRLHLHGEDGRPIDFDEEEPDASEEITEAAGETAEAVAESAEKAAEEAAEAIEDAAEMTEEAEEKPADE
jgi:MinD-like ATPase involved in chromosome partitioning or flagellar assembly